MTRFKNLKLIGSFLTLMLIASGSSFSFTSCITDAEEPFVEKPVTPDETEDPADDPTEDPADDPAEEEPGEDNPSEDEPSTDDPAEDDPTTDDPSGEEPGEDNPNGGETNKDKFVLPSEYTYPLSYVMVPSNLPQQVKEYTGFTLNFNKDNHTANYVAWELLASETTGSENRNDYNYWVDSSVVGCLDKDYAYNTYSYERGHMCPAADQKWSPEAMYDCMVMANMAPQLRSLNSGLWGTLENKERDWAKRDGAIWIVAGPLYSDDDDLYIGKAQARVPSAYFKAFLYINTNKPRAIAFVLQNGANPGNLEDYAMSIDQLEAETGFDFFPALPDEIENEIEATYSFADWN